MDEFEKLIFWGFVAGMFMCMIMPFVCLYKESEDRKLHPDKHECSCDSRQSHSIHTPIIIHR
jgi:hypothetical protein